VYDAPVPTERIFAACAPGLEPVLAAELEGLGLGRTLAVDGGVEAEGDDAVALACCGSRVAEAVRLRLFEGPASEAPRARTEAQRRLGAAAELHLRREAGRATLSLDCAGEPLHKRGWRERVGAAPLRETVAAGLLLHAGWNGDRPFLDPMCGSGTIAIEAALVAARHAPGLDREFAFERLPGHDARRTRAVRERLRAGARPITAPIHASDRNMGALRLAQKNAAAAGVAASIRFERADAAAREVPPGGPGLCIANPPWGVRLDEDAAGSWRALAALAGRLAGWELLVLGPDRGLERLLPIRAASATPLSLGGRGCLLLAYRP
jgi:putative N6-adenine-specific DNA methylase